MTPLVSLVQATTYELTPGHTRLPPLIWGAFSLINRIHGVWRWYRRCELYRQPDNLLNLLGGHIIEKTLGTFYLVRVAAQCLLVATRLLECVQQHATLLHAGKRWWQAIKGDYLPPLNVDWDKGEGCACLSASTVNAWKSAARSLIDRLHRMAVCTWGVAREAFKLSMAMMDVADAFCWSPSIENEGVRESVVNITKWVDAATENKEELLENLVANRLLVERLLAGSKWTYEQLYAGVSDALSKTELLAKGAKKTSHAYGKAFITSGKRVVDGAFVITGLGNFRPLILAS